MVLEGNGSDPFSGHFEYCVVDRWRDGWDRFLAHAFNPFVRFQEGDVHFLRILAHAGDRILVEIDLDSLSVLDRDLLIPRVVISPGDLSFDVFAHGQRIDQAESLLEGHIDAMKYDLPAFGHLHGVDLSANRALTARTAADTAATIVDGDAARPALRQRRTPIRHFGHHVEGPQPVVAIPEPADASTLKPILLVLGRVS